MAEYLHRGTRAIQRMVEYAPSTGGLALWVRHENLPPGEDATPVATDGNTIFYGGGFERLANDLIITGGGRSGSRERRVHGIERDDFGGGQFSKRDVLGEDEAAHRLAVKVQLQRIDVAGSCVGGAKGG